MENGEFLNAYEITNVTGLKWSVATYKVVPVDGTQPQHEDRGKAKEIIWQLKFKYKESCKGYGFVIDVDESTIVVPSTWEIPAQDNFNGYKVSLSKVFDAQATNPLHEVIIKGILRESVKKHFKEVPSNELGDLWQDYGDFCKYPSTSSEGIATNCRKFIISPEVLKNNHWVLKVELVTKIIDSKTLFDYYQSGDVNDLAEMIRAKRANRLTRQNEPTAIRVLFMSDSRAEVLEIEKPDEILTHALLEEADQKKLSNLQIACKRYKKPSEDIPLFQLRLILDSQITQGEHDRTIINPQERFQWYLILRNFINGMDAYHNVVNLATEPVSVELFETNHILPPAIRIRVSPTEVGVLSAPANSSIKALAERAKDRARMIKKFGYLDQRPINPILVCPTHYGERRAIRLQKDLNWLVAKQGLDFRFGTPLLYATVHDIVKVIERESYDSVFAVLPEGSYAHESETDTHDQIKKSIGFPSQCIHLDNTLSPQWLGKPWSEIKAKDFGYAQRIENQYLLCIQNLLVKHHWVPFAPATPFNYNVHVGIDVGGMHNNKVMASIGHGFANPSEGLVFLPKEIEIDTQKAEPIPTRYLFDGLYSLFDELYHRLNDAGIRPDFNRILFFRDGVFRGLGDVWNELDALNNLRQTLLNKGWIDGSALWTAVEVSKRAGDWRILRSNGGRIENPVVGKCVFPFKDEQTAIVCTTGSPYLSHGTASPLFIRVKDIYREADRDQVLTDIVWEADMCYTKLDMAMSLPWVLHIADTGALQQSKAYQITGITV